MPTLLTLPAIVVGIALGIRFGGDLRRARRCRPTPLWPFALGIALLAASLPLDANWETALQLGGSASLLIGALANLRLGGMVVVATGLALGMIPDVPALASASVLTAGWLLGGMSAARGRGVSRRSDCDYTRRIAPLGEGPAAAAPTRRNRQRNDLCLPTQTLGTFDPGTERTTPVP